MYDMAGNDLSLFAQQIPLRVRRHDNYFERDAGKTALSGRISSARARQGMYLFSCFGGALRKKTGGRIEGKKGTKEKGTEAWFVLCVGLGACLACGHGCGRASR